MDEFAQTRQPDDLFDDDFTPIEETVTPSTQVAQPESSGSRNHHHRGGHQQQRGPRDQREHRKTRGLVTSQRDNGEVAPQAVASRDEQTSTTEEGGAAAERRPEAVKGDRSGTGGVKKVGSRYHTTKSQIADLDPFAHLEKADRRRTHGATSVDSTEERRARRGASSSRSRRGGFSTTRAARGGQAARRTSESTRDGR